MKVITVNKLCWAYNLAISHNIKKLKDHCEQQISVNTKNVFACKDFIKCDHDVLIGIVKLNSLHCKEIEIFDACIAWAKEMCRRKSKECKNMKYLRAELADVITQIRFCSMTIEEFAEICNRKYEGFFTTNDKNEILCMYSRDYKSERFNQIPRISN